MADNSTEAKRLTNKKRILRMRMLFDGGNVLIQGSSMIEIFELIFETLDDLDTYK